MQRGAKRKNARPRAGVSPARLKETFARDASFAALFACGAEK